MRILLDTCAIIWACLEPDRLSVAARSVLEKWDSEVFISPISGAEISCAVERGRLQLDVHWKEWFRTQIQVNQWGEMPIDLFIVEEAYSLPPPFHKDPADRMLVATARKHDLKIVTGDDLILKYPHVDRIW